MKICLEPDSGCKRTKSTYTKTDRDNFQRLVKMSHRQTTYIIYCTFLDGVSKWVFDKCSAHKNGLSIALIPSMPTNQHGHAVKHWANLSPVSICTHMAGCENK